MKRTVTDKEVKEILKENQRKGDENIGKKIGNIVLVKKLGQGAMGAVYLGADIVVKRWVAVKVLIRELFEKENQFQYMKRLLIEEGRNLAKVQHAGIILVHGVDPDYPALIMEYIDGMTFHDYLYQEEIKAKWGFPAFRQWFLSKMLDVAEAMRFAHAHGLIHKDLKPSNIMISENEQGKLDKMTIIDFGLAQDNRKIKLTDGEAVIGTPSYMAPEQWSDLWEIDRRTDVFSFGIILYEILMQTDYHGEWAEMPQIQSNIKNSGYLQSRVGHLPIDQRTIFELCLAYDRAQRAGGMLEVIGLLKSLQLALKHRKDEFPGTSFPKPPEKKKVSIEPEPRVRPPETEEGSAEAHHDIAPPPRKPKRKTGTILGHPSAEREVVAEEPTPASEEVGESIDVSLSELDVEEAIPEEASPVARWKVRAFVLLIILGITLPVVAILLRGRKSETMKQLPTASNPVVPDMRSAPKTPLHKVKKIPPKPVVKTSRIVIAKIFPPKPLPPKAPAKGKLPSLKYTVYLYKQEVTWCKKNDKYRDRYGQSRLWLTWCLRKRAVKMYMRDKENPEITIALLDEVKANMCFWERLFRKSGKYRVKDLGLAKECKRIRNLIYKKFTYYISGKRLKALDQYLQNRRSHRAKIRAKWKKTHVISQ